MKKYILQLAAGDLDMLREHVRARVSSLCGNRRFESESRVFVSAMKQSSDLRKWWEEGRTLPKGSHSLGEYDLVVRRRPVGKVELIVERSKANRLLVACDDPTIDLEERFAQSFTETYWVRYAEPAVDDWFVGDSQITLQRKQGLLNVARGPESKLFVSDGERFIEVCDIKAIRGDSTAVALQVMLDSWKGTHELRKSAQMLVDAYRNWLKDSDKSRLQKATAEYLSLLESGPSTRNKVLKAFSVLFQMIAEDLQFNQHLSFLTFMLMRDVEHETTGKKKRSGNSAWHRELTNLDSAQLQSAHHAVLTELPTEKKHAALAKLVSSKIEGEASLAANRPSRASNP